MPTTTAAAAAPSTGQVAQSIATQVASSTQVALKTFLPFYFAHLGLLQFLSVIISAAFIAGITWIVIDTGWVTLRVERFKHVVLQADIEKHHVKESWESVERHFFKGDENDLKVALLEADTLLNDALRSAGVLGAQLGDRLRNVKPEQLPNIDEVWQAHRLRNQIAHEPEFKLKRDLAERALTIYEKALGHLGVFEGHDDKNKH